MSKIARLQGTKLSPVTVLAQAIEDVQAGKYDKVVIVLMNEDETGVDWSSMSNAQFAYAAACIQGEIVKMVNG